MHNILDILFVCSSIYIVLYILKLLLVDIQGRAVWPEEMVERTGYALEDLRECYVNLYRAFTRVHEPQQHAIRDKYRSSKWVVLYIIPFTETDENFVCEWIW